MSLVRERSSFPEGFTRRRKTMVKKSTTPGFTLQAARRPGIPGAARAFLLLALLPLTAAAQGGGRPPSPLGGSDFYPFGGLGAEGDVLAAKKERVPGIPPKAGVLRIRKVYPGGPAEKAGLHPGDLIYGAGRKIFPGKGLDACLDAFEKALERAEAKAPGKLVLLVLRDGKRTKVTVRVRVLGSHSGTCPEKCRKCRKILEEALAYLLSSQQKDGSWNTPLGGLNGKVAVTSLAGRALVWGRGLGLYTDKAVSKALDFVLKRAGRDPMMEAMRSRAKGANWSQVNWSLAYAIQFAATAAKGKAPSRARKKIAEWIRELAENQEKSGGWGHGPGGPNALGYVELEIMSNQVLLGWALAGRSGLELPREALKKAVAYVDACTGGDGGTAYSTRPGQIGFGDPGRTAGAWLALDLLGMGKKRPKMFKFFYNRMDELPSGHVSPVMHILAAAMATRRKGKRYFHAFWKRYRPYLMVSRTEKGAFGAMPTRESRTLHSNTDRGMGPAWITASFALVLEAGMGRIGWLTGKR